jgi:hypothetical protein
MRYEALTMSNDPKEPVNFRLGRRHKRALVRLAAERDKPVGELIREVIEEFVAQEERRVWEAEARRASRAVAKEAENQSSVEAETLRALEANLEDFAREWIWEEDEE